MQHHMQVRRPSGPIPASEVSDAFAHEFGKFTGVRFKPFEPIQSSLLHPDERCCCVDWALGQATWHLVSLLRHETSLVLSPKACLTELQRCSDRVRLAYCLTSRACRRSRPIHLRSREVRRVLFATLCLVPAVVKPRSRELNDFDAVYYLDHDAVLLIRPGAQ